METYNVIDLFAGAGGLSEGFKQAGFTILAANEIEKTFAETYRLNNPDTKVFVGDIRHITAGDFRKECNIDGKKVHIIIGGPPCQGFSMAGRRNPTDPRNSLFMEFLRFVKEFKPQFFVMENVPGILNMKTEAGERVVDIIEKEFEKIGYRIKYKKLLAADYGVPQKRKRVFFIGTNTNAEITFPKETHSETPSILLDGTKMKKWVGVGKVIMPKNNVDRSFFHTPRMIEGFRNRKKKNAEKGKGFGWQILDMNKPSYTISARYWKDGADALIKYSDTEIRMLTPEEAAAIQSFPNDYKFAGSKRHKYIQIGNAVPVKLAKAVAEEIKNNL